MTTKIDALFSSSGLAADLFVVTHFKGRESLCRTYEYEVTLKSFHHEVELEQFTQCSFQFALGSSRLTVHGILAEFEQHQQSGDFTLYKAKLVPRLWRLGLYRTNEVYLGQDLETTITQVLEETGLVSGIDFECRFSDSYRIWPFRVQYSETFLDFIHRIIERDGVYYYFDQSGESEKVIFTDSQSEHPELPGDSLQYLQVGGVNAESAQNTITAFLGRQQPVPAKVVVKDYNDENPLVDISGEAEVDANAWGEVFIYGDNIESPEEAKQLAQVRAEELLCRKKQFHGESYVNRMQPGYLITLEQHFRPAYNRDYLILEIEHEGFTPGFQTHRDEENSPEPPLYRNRFTAIAGDIQYRPPRIVAKQRIYGTLNAHIDGEGDGEYAELDETGRYRVTLPFDRVIRNEGKASHWVRMAQPYIGEGHGMHFPLHKGTEVLLTFIDGDPDRPVISGAVPNHLQSSVVDQGSQTNSRIKTASGNLIELEDQEGKGRIKLKTPQAETYLHLGAPNADGEGFVYRTGGILKQEGFGGLLSVIAAKGSEGTSGDTPSQSGLGHDQLLKKGKGAPLTWAEQIAGDYLVERRVGERYLWTSGNEYIFGGDKVFNVGNGWEENHTSKDTVPGNPDADNLSGLENAAPTSLNKGSTLVSRTFGNQWNYTDGDSTEIYDGDLYSHTRGTSNSVTTGAHSETFAGAFNSTIAGAEAENKLSLAESLQIGAVLESFIGGKLVAEFDFGTDLYPQGTVKAIEAATRARVNRVEAKKEKINTIKTNTETIQSQVISDGANLINKKSTVESISSKVESIKSRAADTKTKTDKIDSFINKVTSSVEDVGSDVVTHKSSINKIDTALNDYKSSVTSVSAMASLTISNFTIL
ncbi:MAG: type VI secretion system tip protein VgrG [Gammaproteobacteria bacterium]|nr:type VI secretion system tip protein VgrG [Gammaproteobacteria bacterium]